MVKTIMEEPFAISALLPAKEVEKGSRISLSLKKGKAGPCVYVKFECPFA